MKSFKYIIQIGSRPTIPSIHSFKDRVKETNKIFLRETPFEINLQLRVFYIQPNSYRILD